MMNQLNIDSSSQASVTNTGNMRDAIIDQSKKTKISIGSIVAVVVLLLIGFGIYKATGGGSLEKQLIGTWEGNDSYAIGRYHYAGEITFKSDHTYVFKNHDTVVAEGTWKINDSKNLVINGMALTWDENYNSFSMDGQTWYLSGDVMYMENIRYDRQ